MFKSFIRFSALVFSFTVGITSGFTSSDFQDVLVVASTRNHGKLSEVARYCKPDDVLKFSHIELAPRVTTMDLFPFLGDPLLNPAVILPHGHRHIQADARSYKGFGDGQFDLIFMELPASCNVSGVAESDILNKTDGMHDHIAIIPEIIKNLASKLKPGGRMEIEHLPLTCMLSDADAFKESSDEKGIPNIQTLMRKDPFTIYTTNALDKFFVGLRVCEEERLKALLSSKTELKDFKKSYLVAQHIFNDGNPLKDKAMEAELRFLDHLIDAIEFRAKKEDVFKEVIVNLMVGELKHGSSYSPDSYFRMACIYAHMLDLRAHIEPLKAIMEPLGLKDVAVKVRKESYNGRLNPWFIVATKSGNPSAAK